MSGLLATKRYRLEHWSAINTPLSARKPAEVDFVIPFRF